MNILFLTQLFPYPLDSGAKIKTYHTLRFLSQRHRITLLSFVRNEEEQTLAAELEKFCHKVETCLLPRSRSRNLAALLKAFSRGRSFIIQRDYHPQMKALVQEALEKESFDLIQADRLQMAQYLPEGNGATLVLDQHNVESEIIGHLVQQHRWLEKALLRIEHRNLRRFEARACAHCQHIICVTEEDRRHLRNLLKENPGTEPLPGIHVVPIGVDCRAMAPANSPKEEGGLLFVGPLHWPPNAEGIAWFAQEVWPKIRQRCPRARLRVIGANASPRVRRLAHLSGIELLGYVKDILPELHRAQAMVVPLLAGSGLRVKILTAMAAGAAVVSTPVGYAGIDAIPGEHLLAANTAEEFAQAVISVLGNPFLRLALERAGRRLVETSYDLPLIYRRLQEVYELIEGGEPALAAAG